MNEYEKKSIKIDERTIKQSEIRIFPFVDENNVIKHVFGLETGAVDKNFMVIATIDANENRSLVRNVIRERINSLKNNPAMRDIETLSDMKDIYKKGHFKFTDEAKEIFSNGEIVGEKEIDKTHIFNPETRKMVKVDKVKENVSKEDDVEENSTTQVRLYNTILPNEFPTNEEEAKAWDECLSKTRQLNRNDLVKYMKELSKYQKNKMSTIYKEYLVLKACSMINSKWHAIGNEINGEAGDETQQLREYIYLTTQKDNVSYKEINTFLEHVDISKEQTCKGLYLQEVSMLLKVANYKAKDDNLKFSYKPQYVIDKGIDNSKENSYSKTREEYDCEAR